IQSVHFGSRVLQGGCEARLREPRRTGGVEGRLRRRFLVWEDRMKRLCALLVISALVFPNCAARGPAFTAQRVADPPELWRAYAAKLPIGSIVRIRTSDGEDRKSTRLNSSHV